MPKRNYVPTDADRVTGENLRALRKRRGETLKETVERSSFGKDASTLAATERGERQLTELEATKLAAHFGTTPDKIFAETPEQHAERNAWQWRGEPATEQQWLGNTPGLETTGTTAPTLFAVPDAARSGDVVGPTPRTMLIDLDAPLSLADYREQVWIPYLEHRYATDLRQTG